MQLTPPRPNPISETVTLAEHTLRVFNQELRPATADEINAMQYALSVDPRLARLVLSIAFARQEAADATTKLREEQQLFGIGWRIIDDARRRRRHVWLERAGSAIAIVAALAAAVLL